MIKYLLGLLTAFVPSFAYALPESPSLFTPPTTDKSVILLQQIFGSVGAALHGVGGSHLLGNLFEVFNMGVWVLAGMFVMYMTLMSVVNTAKDGQFMGRGQMSAWVVVRTVGGITALLPKFSGYSFIQVVVMWVVVQGIGLADHTWSVGLQYFEKGGTVYAQKSKSGADSEALKHERDDLKLVVTDAAKVLNSLICQYAVTRNQKIKAQTLSGKKTGTKGTVLPREQGDAIVFPIGKDSDYPDSFCGRYAWAGESADYLELKKAGIMQVAMDLMPVASYIVAHQSAGGSPYTDADACLKNTKSDVQEGLFCRHTNALIASAMDYMSIIRPARAAVASTQNSAKLEKMRAAFTDAKAEGWLMAGKYYFSITNPETASIGLDRGNFQFDTTGVLSKSSYTALTNSSHEKHLSDPALTEFQKSLQSTCSVINRNDATCAGNIPSPRTYWQQSHWLVDSIYAQSLAQASQTGDMGALKRKLNAAKGAIFKLKPGEVDNLIKADIRRMVQGALEAWSSATLRPAGDKLAMTYQDPIRRLRALGLKLMSTVITFWKEATRDALIILASTAAAFSLTIAGTAIGVFMLGAGGAAITSGVGTALTFAFQVIMASVFMYLPVGIAVSTPLFMIGMTLGVYVPLIPFIVFLFSALGWFIAVVEAMVAAPLVALGLTHPEGHDLLGKAEQSLILLLSVFLRPVAMILGFFIGIVLIFTIMQVLDEGFFSMFLEQLSTRGSMADTTNIAVLSGMLIIYTFTVVAVVNQSFSLIYLLADRLVRWIGGSPEQSSVAQMMGEVRGQSEGKMQAGASGGGQMVGGARGSGIGPGQMQGAPKGKQGGGASASQEPAGDGAGNNN